VETACIDGNYVLCIQANIGHLAKK